MSTEGVKRKRDESPDIEEQSLPNTDVDIKNKAKQIMEAISVEIENAEDTDNGMTSLKKYIRETISKMDNGGKKATIAILGGTGEGKSSLLNAVVGEEDLLPSGSFGACTAVITQVEANLSDSNYIAEIDLISEEDWVNELAFSEKNEETYKEKITALFGNNAVKKTSEELQSDDKCAEIDEILSNKRKTISNSDRSKFATEVSRYIQNSQANPGVWYWPLVKSVTIKIPNCCELLEHIVLVDLPGTGDCNMIRNDLWKSKLKECSSMWIVSNIKRVSSDDNTWRMLKYCNEVLGPGEECKSIKIICTHTDQIESKQYLKSTQFTLEDNMELETQCILHRNNRAKETMKRKMESNGIFTTDVLTVSSTACFDHKSHLTRTETEIPNLQDVLRRLNKRINQKLTRDYVNEAKGVLSLIQSVQLDTDENMTKADIKNKLEKNLEEELKTLDGHFASLNTILDRSLSKAVKDSTTSSDLTTEKMFSICQPNSRINCNTYQALCRKNGRHCPKDWKESLDLNDFLSKHMNAHIKKEFKWMLPKDDGKNVPHNNENKRQSVQDKLDKFSIISSVFPKSPMLNHLGKFIKTQENKLKDSLREDICQRKNKIYTSISEVIKKHMTPGYKKAADVEGKGALQMMEDIISEAIGQLKPQVFNEAKNIVLVMFNDLKEHVKQTLNSELMTLLRCSLSQTGKITMMDVSIKMTKLDTLAHQLSD